MASEDVAPDGAWLAGVLQLQRCRAYGAEMSTGNFVRRVRRL
jgi:hypothetical protein